MPKEFSRTRRVGEQMQRELAQLIQQEIKDPRVGMVTVSGVNVSRDLSLARIYVSLLDDDKNTDEVLAVLQKASGFLRRELGKSMSLRTIPSLQFIYDDSIERGNRLSRLIDDAVSREKN